MNIITFGDSLVYGAFDTEGGWVQRLRREYDMLFKEGKASPVFVYNDGISGETTESLSNRLNMSIMARMDRREPNILIFGIGMTDTYCDITNGTTRIKPIEFKQNIQSIVFQAKPFAHRIAFLSLIPVDFRADPTPWKPGWAYRMPLIEEYDAYLRETCQILGMPVIDLMSAFKTQPDLSSLLHDGIHPNERGHQLILSTIKQSGILS